jgi:hypothetical protein
MLELCLQHLKIKHINDANANFCGSFYGNPTSPKIKIFYLIILVFFKILTNEPNVGTCIMGLLSVLGHVLSMQYSVKGEKEKKCVVI